MAPQALVSIGIGSPVNESLLPPQVQRSSLQSAQSLPVLEQEPEQATSMDLAELANTITHGLGIVLSLLAGAYLWQHKTELALGLRICCILFAATMTIVYVFSTLSHAVHAPRLRSRMRAWDQGTIYLLIAGTYSPFIWVASPPGWTAVVMGGVWLAAAWGFYLKVVAKYRIEASSTVTYVLLGWIPAFVLFARTPTICVLLMVAGGLSYTFGIVFLIRSHRAWYMHSLWHLSVIGGSACHFIAIWNLLPHG